MILNICMKSQEDIFNGFHVKHRQDFVTELLLTKFLQRLNTCMKFYEHILNGFKVIERT